MKSDQKVFVRINNDQLEIVKKKSRALRASRMFPPGTFSELPYGQQGAVESSVRLLMCRPHRPHGLGVWTHK